MVIVLRKGEREGERDCWGKKKKFRSKHIKPWDKRMLLSRTIRVEEMLELGRVDFEVTLTLCRWERASCAPCYVLARFNSDGGSSFPRSHSPPLSLSTSAFRTTARARRRICPPSSPLWIVCKDTKFAPQWKEVTLVQFGFPLRRASSEKDFNVSIIVDRNILIGFFLFLDF